ncbi:ribonuclease HII [Thermodesulfobacteriota bacterium]
MDPFLHETRARQAGYQRIAGVDEAGRGPLAGPVVAAAVMIPPGVRFPGVQDSKKMTALARETAFPLIQQGAAAVGIGVVSHFFIDKHNILQATLEAMKLAVLFLEPAAEYILVDGIQKVPLSLPQTCLKKGDQLSHSISSASVIAKVYRDRIMRCYHQQFPEYDFQQNKGYGTRRHMAAIRRHGPSPIHRVTFKGVYSLDNEQN